MYECRVERDSITEYGERLVTFVVTMPRIVLAELNTHKMLSKSSASSRAIPVEKQIARLNEDLFLPVHWGKNQKGMQAEQELTEEEIGPCEVLWQEAADSAVKWARKLLERGVHKQITNRLLEPFMWHTVIISGTEWSNFFHLRDHKDAQPEIAKAARMMREAYNASTPKLLIGNEWHLPFTNGEDASEYIDQIVKISVGRSARVSYLNHDGKRDPDDDVKLAERVLASGHMAPYEHVARPMTWKERDLFGRRRIIARPQGPGGFADLAWTDAGVVDHFLGNFNGWVQARKMIHGEWDVKAFGEVSQPESPWPPGFTSALQYVTWVHQQMMAAEYAQVPAPTPALRDLGLVDRWSMMLSYQGFPEPMKIRRSIWDWQVGPNADPWGMPKDLYKGQSQ